VLPITPAVNPQAHKPPVHVLAQGLDLGDLAEGIDLNYVTHYRPLVKQAARSMEQELMYLFPSCFLLLASRFIPLKAFSPNSPLSPPASASPADQLEPSGSRRTPLPRDCADFDPHPALPNPAGSVEAREPEEEREPMALKRST
jgi:hypothetical protein